MGRRYALTATRPTSGVNLTILSMDSYAGSRPSLFEILFGCPGVPADQEFYMVIGRFTAPGTGTARSPVALDPADPASRCGGLYNHTVEPTYLTDQPPLSFVSHRRFTFRWTAMPENGIFSPAVDTSGLGIQFNLITSGTPKCDATFMFEE